MVTEDLLTIRSTSKRASVSDETGNTKLFSFYTKIEFKLLLSYKS